MMKDARTAFAAVALPAYGNSIIERACVNTSFCVMVLCRAASCLEGSRNLPDKLLGRRQTVFHGLESGIEAGFHDVNPLFNKLARMIEAQGHIFPILVNDAFNALNRISGQVALWNLLFGSHGGLMTGNASIGSNTDREKANILQSGGQGRKWPALCKTLGHNYFKMYRFILTYHYGLSSILPRFSRRKRRKARIWDHLRFFNGRLICAFKKGIHSKAPRRNNSVLI